MWYNDIMKKILTITAVAILTGCANITLRPQLDYNEGPYFCTKQVNKLIQHGKTDGILAKVMLPCFYIDWPFDAVTDTVLLPYDWIAYSIRQNRNNK